MLTLSYEKGVEKPIDVPTFVEPVVEFRIGAMKALSVVHMMDSEQQKNIDDFVLQLNGLIRSRYALSIDMWSLAEAMHKKQQRLDKDEQISDSVAVSAGAIALLGLALAPLTGDFSEVIALAADAAAFAQTGAEIASYVLSLENQQVAKDILVEAHRLRKRRI